MRESGLRRRFLVAFNFKLIEHEKSKEAPKISSVFQSTWVNPFNVENKFGLILEGLALIQLSPYFTTIS